MADTHNWRTRVCEEGQRRAYSQVEWHAQEDVVQATASELGMTVQRYLNAQNYLMNEFNRYLRNNQILIPQGEVDTIYRQFSDQRNAQQGQRM